MPITGLLAATDAPIAAGKVKPISACAPEVI
jgi:hypothetical protein